MKERGYAGEGALLFLAVLVVVGLLGWWLVSSVEASGYYVNGSWSPVPPVVWAFVGVGVVLALLGAVALGGGGRLGRSGLSVYGRRRSK